MLKKYFFLLLVVSFSVALTSCEKIQTATEGPPPEMVDIKDAISLEYGTLVAVTAHPELRNWASLWFVKPDKTISMVWVNAVQGEIGTVATIPRK